MGLFQKKEKVPEIPPFRQLKEESFPSLPSIGKVKDDLNHDFIKSNLEEKNEDLSRFKPGEEAIPSLNKEEVQTDSSNKNFFNNSQLTQEKFENNLYLKGPDSIFIKLEKFQQAKKETNQIKKDLEEATNLIKQINEVTKKEETEIKEIVSSLDSIKRRFNEIDSLVFDKV